MAFSPQSAPIKTGAVRQAADVDVEADIIKVATRFTQNLVTFKYLTINSDFAGLEKDTTPEFARKKHDALSGTVDSFKAAIVNARAVSTGDVRGVILSSRDNDTATALAVVAQTIRNRANPTPRARLRLFEITLLKTAKGWKVDTIGNVSKPNG
jgi:hypothetical protein